MSRAIEDYICASEDRSHYNNEVWYLNGFFYPYRRPEINVYQITNQASISDENQDIIQEIGNTIAALISTQDVDENEV